jgi:hypothetical protein
MKIAFVWQGISGRYGHWNDSGCAPLTALYAVGGFDEELDKWWSFDNYSVGKRADLLGYKFMNLFNNPGIAKLETKPYIKIINYLTLNPLSGIFV